MIAIFSRVYTSGAVLQNFCGRPYQARGVIKEIEFPAIADNEIVDNCHMGYTWQFTC
jgi:hypothetical protein